MSVGDKATSGIDGGMSPRNRSTLQEAMESMGPLPDGMNPLESRVADPDVQATVMDFLDFTEYLPSDIIRSMTLVGKLDHKNRSFTAKVNDLTERWSQLPNIPTQDRLDPIALRADISRSLDCAVGSRVYSHVEALRIQESVNRHYNRAKYILNKLESMKANFPSEEDQPQQQQSNNLHQIPVLSEKLTGVTREKLANSTKVSGKEDKMRRPRQPRITVPGDVLAPFEINYNYMSSDASDSSDESTNTSLSVQKRINDRSTPAGQLKIRLKTPKAKVTKNSQTPKEPKMRRVPTVPNIPLSQLKPPPANAVIGSPDAPWLQLTPWELAKLRKRMKKNANWTPSETMVARELKSLGRGPEEYKTAKKKAEEEELPFDPILPGSILDPATGQAILPPGAMSLDSITASGEVPTSNRGMKLNEAKKLKRDMAKLAAQEAEESAKKFEELARKLIEQTQGFSQQGEGTQSTSQKPSRSSKKRKRESVSEGGAERYSVDNPDGSVVSSASKPVSAKRSKTETPVPPPMLTSSGSGSNQPPPEKQLTLIPAMQTPSEKIAPLSRTSCSAVTMYSQTPVPLPQLPLHGTGIAKKACSVSPQIPTPSASTFDLMKENVPTTALETPVVALDHTTKELSFDGVSTAESNRNQNQQGVKSKILSIPSKPFHETPVPLPIHSPKKTPNPTRESSRKLEKKAAPTTSEKKTPVPLPSAAVPGSSVLPIQITSGAKSSSRAGTPISITSVQELQCFSLNTSSQPARRPPSRSAKAASQEPQSILLAPERSRHASTARNTPTPEVASGQANTAASPALAINSSRPSNATGGGRHTKRPAPGVVSTTSTGSSSAVGRRKAATRKKARSNKKKDGDAAYKTSFQEMIVMEEVDDEGNVIDPDEPRYCLCNRVSFGTMIECENKDVRCSFPSFSCENCQDVNPLSSTKLRC